MRMVQVNPDELPANQTVDIRDLMDMVWRRKWLIMFVTLVITALAAGYSFTRIPEYTSTATVLVRPILTNPLETNPIEQVSVQTELRIATSASVGQVAADKLGLPRSTVPDLIDNVSVSSPEETQILEISYAAHGRKEAQEGAQAFAEAYLEFKSNQAIDTISEYTSKLQTNIQQVTTQISDLNNRIVTTPRGTALWQDLLNRRTSLEATRLALQNQLTTLSSLNVDAGQVIQPAQLPLAPSSPNHELNLALGVILGLAIGVAIASIDERARQRRPSEVMLEQYLDAPILGAIPKSRVTLSRLARPAIIGDPRGRAAGELPPSSNEPPRGEWEPRGQDRDDHKRGQGRGQDHHRREPIRGAGADGEGGHPGLRRPPQPAASLLLRNPEHVRADPDPREGRRISTTPSTRP